MRRLTIPQPHDGGRGKQDKGITGIERVFAQCHLRQSHVFGRALDAVQVRRIHRGLNYIETGFNATFQIFEIGKVREKEL